MHFRPQQPDNEAVSTLQRKAQRVRARCMLRRMMCTLRRRLGGAFPRRGCPPRHYRLFTTLLQYHSRAAQTCLKEWRASTAQPCWLSVCSSLAWQVGSRGPITPYFSRRPPVAELRQDMWAMVVVIAALAALAVRLLQQQTALFCDGAHINR